MSNQRIVHANEVDLAVETFGDPADPPVFLIMGAAAPMDWWPDGFCERLAAEARFVIRYDHRDTGQSKSYPPGAPTYTSADLDDDAVALLDALGITRAHVVGVSMGAGMAQQMATDHPERVASLTLISASPAGQGDDLPPMSDELKSMFAEPGPEPDWSDRAAVIEHVVADTRAFQGSVTFTEADMRHLAGRIFDRTVNMASAMTNHWILDSGDTTTPQLSAITAPTLVFHGTEDPLFPYPHGEALARAITGARLIPLEGVGHGELPPQTWSVVVPAIVEHTAAVPPLA